jgi:protein-disulfide isomerase
LIRSLVAFAAAVIAIAAAPPQDWRLTTGVAPSGGFTAGNPAARVKLVEYLSYTCSHCGDFVKASKPTLVDTMVRGGSVQIETRSAARDAYDLSAWMVARCGGPKRFMAINSAIFADQAGWIARGEAYAQANLAAVQAMPQLKQLRTIADRSGLTAIGTRAGITPAAMNACFATDTELKRVLAMTDAAFKKIPGTPGFEINGTLADGVASWDALEPKLRAAGAR